MLHNTKISSSGAISEMRRGQLASANLVTSTDKLTTNVYSNILIPNDSSTSIRAEYTTTQDIPLLSDMQDYTLKVSRLSIPMSGVPLFKFKDDAYKLTWAYQPKNNQASNLFTEVGEVYTVNFDQAVAPGNPLLQNTPYNRAVFNISDFLYMINAALEQMWTNLLANLAGPGEILDGWNTTSATAPAFVYNCNDNCIEFVQPIISTNLNYPVVFSGFDCGNGNEQFRLLMSDELWSFFNGFQADLYGPNGVIDTSAGGLPFTSLNVGLKFGRGSVFNTNEIGICPIQSVLSTPQIASSLYSFQRASRIIITTSLPLVKESVLISSQGSGNPQRFEILTDFEIPPENKINPNEPVYYYGDDSDRHYNLKDSGPLYKVQIGVFVQWKDGSRTQLYIAPGETFYMKLHFQRKLANDQFQISDKNQYSQSSF